MSFRLVLFTPPALSPAASEPPTVNQLFAAGLRTLHLRKPGASEAQLRAYVAAIDPRYRPRVVTHTHHSLAPELGLGGLHFRGADRPPAPLPRLHAGLSQSTGLHSLGELAEDWAQLDYAFLSPVFNSISKQGYAAAGFEPQALAGALAAASMPVLALGGVTPARLAQLAQLGFAGAGVLGAVWEAPDPLAALAAFQDAL